MNEQRKQPILKLLAGYHSTAGLGMDQAAAMTAAYLDRTSRFSLVVLSAACDDIGKRPGAFPPSAGDLFAACEDVAARMAKPRTPPIDMARYRLAPPAKPRWTREQLADWECPINHASPPYTMRGEWSGDKCLVFPIPAGYPGAGQLAEYGYLTPREAALVAQSRKKDDARFADMDRFARETI